LSKKKCFLIHYFQAEKKKLFHVFLKQFLMVFEKWEPANASQLPEAALTTVPPVEYPLRVDDIIVGCSAGHPAEIILALTEEITQLTSLVSECKILIADVLSV
jgi:hypothetical protein